MVDERGPGAAGELSEEVVRHVAHLARLALSEAEVRRFAGQLSRILDYVRQLNELDTEGVRPTSHPLPVVNVLREDEEKATRQQGNEATRQEERQQATGNRQEEGNKATRQEERQQEGKEARRQEGKEARRQRGNEEGRGHVVWDTEEALANAPQREGDFFRVPKVLDQETA